VFISNTEKEQLWIAVRSLQAKVRDLEIEAVWLKGKLHKEKKIASIKDDAGPWGYKKDGTPRKRPGRPPQVMKVGQP